MDSRLLKIAALALSVLAMVAGMLGMGMSFLFLASSSAMDIQAGTSGFVAGAILIGSGVVAVAVVAAGGSHGVRGDEARMEDSAFRRH